MPALKTLSPPTTISNNIDSLLNRELTRKERVEVASIVFSRSFSDGTSYCIENKFTFQEVTNAILDSPNYQTAAVRPHAHLKNMILSSDNHSLKKTMHSVEHSTENNQTLTQAEKDVIYLKYSMGNAAKTTSKNYGEKKLYEDRNRLDSPVGILSNEADFLTAIPYTYPLGGPILPKYVALAIKDLPTAKNTNIPVYLTHLDQVGSLDRILNGDETLDNLKSYLKLNEDDAKIVLERIKLLQKTELENRLLELKKRIIIAVNNQLKEDNFGCSFDGDGKLHVQQPDALAKVYQITTIKVEHASDVNFDGDRALVARNKGTPVAIDLVTKQISDLTQSERFEAENKFRNDYLLKSDKKEFKRSSRETGIFYIKRNGILTRIILKKTIVSNRYNKKINADTLILDEKTSNLYTTKDGINVKKIHNPIPALRQKAELFDRSIGFDDKIIYPCTQGLGFGKTIIPLPQDIPVESVMAAEKVGDKLKVLIYSSGNVFELDIKDPELLAITRLSGHRVCSTNGNFWVEELKEDQRGYFNADFNGGARASNLHPSTVNTDKSSSFYFGYTLFDNPGITQGTTTQSECGKWFYSRDKDNITIYEKKITNDQKVKEQTLDTIALAIKTLALITDKKEPIDTTSMDFKLLRTLTTMSSIPFDGVAPKHLNFFMKFITPSSVVSNKLPPYADGNKEDVQKLFEYLNEMTEPTLRRLFNKLKNSLSFSHTELCDLIPSVPNPYLNSNATSYDDLKLTKGLEITPGYKGIIVSDYLAYDPQAKLFMPVKIEPTLEGETTNITFSGEILHGENQLRLPVNSILTSVKIDDKEINLATLQGTTINNEDGGEKISYTVAKIPSNLNVNEHECNSNLDLKHSIKLPDDSKIYRIVNKARQIPNLEERLKYIRKEYGKIARYRINKDTANSKSFESRFDDMKKGKYYCGVCADHALLGHAILVNSGFNTVVAAGNSSGGRYVIASPGHACNAVVINSNDNTSVVEVDLTPPRFSLQSLVDIVKFNLKNKEKKKQSQQKLDHIKKSLEPTLERTIHTEAEPKTTIKTPKSIDTIISDLVPIMTNSYIEFNEIGFKIMFEAGIQEHLKDDFQKAALPFYESAHILVKELRIEHNQTISTSQLETIFEKVLSKQRSSDINSINLEIAETIKKLLELNVE